MIGRTGICGVTGSGSTTAGEPGGKVNGRPWQATAARGAPRQGRAAHDHPILPGHAPAPHIDPQLPVLARPAVRLGFPQPVDCAGHQRASVRPLGRGVVETLASFALEGPRAPCEAEPVPSYPTPLKSLKRFFYYMATKGLWRETLYSVLSVMGRLGLTGVQYKVCLLRYGKNQTQERIARRLGITQQMVSLHLAAAARKYPALAAIERRKGRVRQVRMAV